MMDSYANVANWHWVLRLEYLCRNFDPFCDQPYIVGANKEELVVVHLIAMQEGIQPQQWKK